MADRQLKIKAQRKEELRQKRNELIYAILEPEQGYSYSDIAFIFNDLNRSTILRIAKNKPKDYVAKWKKVR